MLRAWAVWQLLGALDFAVAPVSRLPAPVCNFAHANPSCGTRSTGRAAPFDTATPDLALGGGVRERRRDSRIQSPQGHNIDLLAADSDLRNYNHRMHHADSIDTLRRFSYHVHHAA